MIRDNTELVKKVYNAQKENPHKGDWYNLLKDDIQLLSFSMSESEMAVVTAKQVKTVVKRCVKIAALNELKKIQLEKHKNTRHSVSKI